MFISTFLGKLLGLYFSIYGLYIIMHEEKIRTYAQEMLKPIAMFIGGLVSLAIGLLLVLSHNIWLSFYQIIISILCWFVLLKGIALLFFPEKMLDLATKMLEKAKLGLVGWCCLIVGLYLLISSFIF